MNVERRTIVPSLILSHLYKKVNTCDNVTDEKVSSNYTFPRNVYGGVRELDDVESPERRYS